MSCGSFLRQCKSIAPVVAVVVAVCMAAVPMAKAAVPGAYRAAAAEIPDEEPPAAPVAALPIEIKKEPKEASLVAAPELAERPVGSVDLSKCADGTYTGKGRGFAGTITVQVVLLKHTIQSIDILEVEADDAPYVESAKGVIAAILAEQSIDVDTVSGATYSSVGILSAVKAALDKAAGVYVEEEEDTDADDPDLTGKKFKDGVYEGVGKGFKSDIHVKVTIKKGKIKKIAVTQHGEDQPYFDNATALIAAIVKTQSVDVDTVAGATYSSKGILSAVKNALAKAAYEEDPDLTEPEPEPTPDPEKDPPVPGVDDDPSLDGQKYKDGTFEGSATGYNGTISVAVTIAGGAITQIEVTAHTDDEPYMTDAKAVLAAIVQTQGIHVDTVSGATYSSRGIINAVKDALKKAILTEDPDIDAPDEPVVPPAPPVIPDAGGDPDAGYVPVYGLYVDGTYTGLARGYKSIFKATVVIEGGNIASVTLTQDDDVEYVTPCLGILDRIVKRQTTDGIDTVSGATYSSSAILTSVKQALNKALKPPEPEDPAQPEDPADPEQPTDPADPETPTEPDDPAQPDDPAEAEQPTESADPEQPTEPVGAGLAPPADPEQPTDPAEAEQPTEPEEPAESKDPAQPDAPVGAASCRPPEETSDAEDQDGENDAA